MDSNFKPEDRYLAELPPRHIDWFTQATILFGGFLQQFGWFFFGFGMIFFWIFAWNSHAMVSLGTWGKWDETTGTIFAVENTNASENETPVYKITLQYQVDGETHLSDVYKTGGGFSEGQEVPIEYNRNVPSIARMEGTRRGLFSSWVLFVALFPIVGLILVSVSLLGNWNFLKLLKIGEYVRGKRVSKEATGGSITINNVTYPIYKYKFEFFHKDKPYYAICNTHLTQTVEDEEKEIILYDRFHPEKAIVYDAMPNAPKILPEGIIDPAYISKGWVLFLPVVC
ncbi:MAG: DUF3592 domain-containing protein, partial [Saprospiraceae bacterium]|nr:DUF3592 domain-containing protein [Saprospiraceae bacterium]